MLGRTRNPSLENEDAVATAVRIVRDIDLTDPVRLVRRIEFPSRVELASPAELDLSRRLDIPNRIGIGRKLMAQARAALMSAVEHLPQRRERRRRRRTIALAALGLIGLAVLGGLFARRQVARNAARAESSRLDREALERATGEGMGAAPGARESVPVPMDMSVPDEELVEPRVDDMLTEQTVVDQATNGIGVAPRV
jgi:hypothetical protein